MRVKYFNILSKFQSTTHKEFNNILKIMVGIKQNLGFDVGFEDMTSAKKVRQDLKSDQKDIFRDFQGTRGIKLNLADIEETIAELYKFLT